MAGVNIDNVGLTFTNYLKDIDDTLNHASKARRLCRKQKKWGGANLEWRVHSARSTAIGNVEDGGAFPVADKQDYQAAKAYRKFTVGAIQLTDGVMATAAKSPHVAKDVITSEVKGLMNNILKFENGMFFKNGDGSVSTVMVDYAGGNPDLVEVDDARMLWDGGVYQVYDTALGTNRGNVTVEFVSSAPAATGYAQVDLVGNLPAAAVVTDKLVWNGCLNRGITGLSKLIDDTSTTFQNISTTAYPRYTSLVLGNSGTARELTPQLFRQMLAGIKSKAGNDRPAEGITVLTSHWDAINVEELYEGELRLSPSSKVGGLAVAAFQSALGRVDIISDSDAPYGKMFFADFSQIYRGVQKPLGWRRQGGQIFKRSDVSGVWTATAIEISELFIRERHTSGRMDDLANDIKCMY